MTWDQGSEMAYHHHIAELFDQGVFFAHPGKPWQRGTNENTNGLLRQYFPKGQDLSTYSAQDLRAVEDRLNHRPRKALHWRTPAEVFHAALTQ
jgi:IS30 family transposase